MALDDTVTEILKSEDVAKGRNMVFFWNLQDKKKKMVLTGKNTALKEESFCKASELQSFISIHNQ